MRIIAILALLLSAAAIATTDAPWVPRQRQLTYDEARHMLTNWAPSPAEIWRAM